MNFVRLAQAFLLMLILGFFSSVSLAVVETYEFASDDGRKRYQVLVDELRCPKCQNQNLSGSNSPIAKDLRRELHRMIEEGNDDDAIKSFMVKRYGNFVLYKPPLDKNTIILWSSPLVIGFIALLVAFVFRSRQAKAAHSEELIAQEQQRLQEILEQYH